MPMYAFCDSAIQSGAIKPTDLTASQVQGLVHRKDAKIAALAKTALAAAVYEFDVKNRFQGHPVMVTATIQF